MKGDPIRPPANTPEYLWDAWCSCLAWALSEDDVVAAFRRDSGLNWSPGKTPMDQLIDKATGADERFIRAFVEWFNERVWGDPMSRDDV